MSPNANHAYTKQKIQPEAHELEPGAAERCRERRLTIYRQRVRTDLGEYVVIAAVDSNGYLFVSVHPSNLTVQCADLFARAFDHHLDLSANTQTPQ
jgi:hypothetical protein